jgi:hypothetical protein
VVVENCGHRSAGIFFTLTEGIVIQNAIFRSVHAIHAVTIDQKVPLYPHAIIISPPIGNLHYSRPSVLTDRVQYNVIHI